MLDKPIYVRMALEMLQVNSFESLKDFGSIPVYFANDPYNMLCMIGIPDWRWSYLYSYSRPEEEEGKRLLEALSDRGGPLAVERAEKLAHEISDYMIRFTTTKLKKDY
ncbi:YueH family protein [Paenibacillus peoriae]|uniref:YueH family protein n=1 Tax=Paenibacillus peoriae TaxID=59893 RepID=UPI00215A57A1|nr:YueH family protein [Paenibacillus peoriae]